MSINWVMLQEPHGFVKLPGEKSLYQSPARTSLTLSTPKTYPANNPVSISCDSGTLHLTNQRVVYLPAKSTSDFKSFSSPILNLVDAHITVPWFGPNAWQALVVPVPGGNLPAVSTGIELKLTFKEGGATDFHSTFERIKERLQQAVEAARENGMPSRNQNQFLNGVNMDSVHLDQLPSYEASGADRIAPNDELPLEAHPDEQTAAAAPPSTIQATSARATASNPPPTSSRDETVQPPSDAPPGYEETQQQSIQQALDRRLSGF